MEKIKISIVEDDKIIRDSLKFMMECVEDFEVLAAYDSAEALFKEVNDFIPDVMLMDITLPGITGIEATKVLKIDHPEVDVIMLTIHQDDKLVFDSLVAGASGYLTKNTDPERIVEAVKEARRGGAPMSTQIARMVVTSFQRPTENILTPREEDVLQELCNGKSYKMIADDLFISQDTVRSNIKHI